MASTRQPLESLKMGGTGEITVKKESYYEGANNALLWFIIIVVIVWFLLYAFNPTWVQSTGPLGTPSGQVDIWKALIWAVVIGIIIAVIIWFIRSSRWV